MIYSSENFEIETAKLAKLFYPEKGNLLSKLHAPIYLQKFYHRVYIPIGILSTNQTITQVHICMIYGLHPNVVRTSANAASLSKLEAVSAPIRRHSRQSIGLTSSGETS